MHCRLCKKEDELCKSHIYPEYMYRRAYDSKNKLRVYSSKGYTKKPSKGFYDKLLCRKCEGVIKKYEDYAKCLLYDQLIPELEKSEKGVVKESFDYRLIKLFFASLLWRASLSNQDLFKFCDIGPYEEELRSYLLNESHIAEDRFPILLASTYLAGKRAEGVFLELGKRKSMVNGKSIYHGVVDGFFIVFGVGDVGSQHLQGKGCLREDRFAVIKRDLLTVNDFKELFLEVESQGKFFS